ncbi:crotonase/enoyl-CoA hydratase family protein [Nocardiopsis sp. HNM0947]|uniref:Crotonase/enoyl-CoA hydratase family protein n=1 Tax=Nocardiopsis coralli TaxID=2772213 RepID=A0ABR9P3G9_9ACTN|nr:crotonase/enoyl-CoA hydratase family protein [Nocardiopsis coralli]MBE2998280.1 crotonase/enoyl-CoA hydratase family protein [Nocardiopsis coralli]
MARQDTDKNTVLTEEHGSVLVITFNRPEVRNAVDLGVAERLRDALDAFEARDDLAVAVLTGAGPTFCAGMDLKAYLRGERPSLPGRGFAGITERPPEKPVVAAVEGHALAGGFEVVLSCDLVVAARGARMGLPEVKLGLAAAAGGLQRLPERIPANVAAEWILTGGTYDAERAHELGLVNVLTEKGGTLPAAMELAQRIAANGPLSVRASKQVLREYRGWPEEERWERQRRITDPVLTSEDAQEGARSFAEKRDPVWKGR